MFFAIAVHSLFGIQCSRSRSEKPASISRLQQMAERGNATAQEELGSRFETGVGIQKNLIKSFVWIKKSAEQGNPKAQYGLAYRYNDGIGVEKNQETALYWYRKCAENGLGEWQANAQVAIADFYLKGIGGVKPDRAIAFEWDTRSALQGNPWGQFGVAAWMLREGHTSEDEHIGKVFLAASASKGIAEAQYNLAVILLEGVYTEHNAVEAAQWARKAAEQGHAKAQLLYGKNFLLEGVGVARDEQAAAKWCLKSAEQGNPHAQATIGELYLKGRGVPIDEKIGREWINRAIESDLSQAVIEFKNNRISAAAFSKIRRDAEKAKKLWR